MPSDACLSADTEDLIMSLCCSAEDRLGGYPGGASQLKSHPFFDGIQFDSVRRRRAPYVPYLRYATDTSHFDMTEPDDRSVDTLDSLAANTALNAAAAAAAGGSSCDAAFLDFTFRRFFDADGHAHATRVTDGPAPVYV